MKILTSITFFLFLLSSSIAQLEWFSIEKIDKNPEIDTEFILIKIETDWCGYCKLMDKKVFSNSKVQKALADNYTLVRFNSETQQKITFNDTLYTPRIYPGRKNTVHKLAERLVEGTGKLKYPTIIVMDRNYRVLDILQGYLNKSAFRLWLKQAERKL